MVVTGTQTHRSNKSRFPILTPRINHSFYPNQSRLGNAHYVISINPLKRLLHCINIKSQVEEEKKNETKE